MEDCPRRQPRLEQPGVPRAHGVGLKAIQQNIAQVRQHLFREVVLPGGELYAYPKATEWVTQELVREYRRMAGRGRSGRRSPSLRAKRFSPGTEVQNPPGFSKMPQPIAGTTNYPVRDNEIEFVTDGDSPFAIDADTLITLYYAVNSAYRVNSTFAMNSATASVVRKLKASGDGHYLWTNSLAAGQPATLLGRPVAIWEYMDNVDVSGGSNSTFPDSVRRLPSCVHAGRQVGPAHHGR